MRSTISAKPVAGNPVSGLEAHDHRQEEADDD
jgi:hypothetical protein